jgi:hypothetical protein
MIIMEKGATPEQVQNVVAEIERCGLKADVSRGEFRTVIGVVGDETRVSFSLLATLPGVKEARMVETPYKLVSREYGNGEGRIISVGDGPLAVRNRLSWPAPVLLRAASSFSGLLKVSRGPGPKS